MALAPPAAATAAGDLAPVARRSAAGDPDARAALAPAARARAREILAGRRYRSRRFPSPLNRPLKSVASLLAPVGRFFERLVRRIPGPSWLGWTLVALLVLALAALGTRRAVRRSILLDTERRQRAVRREADAAELERLAAGAEARGDWKEAVRARFRAGLLRLAEDRVVEDRPSLLTRDVRRRLGSEDFDGIARGFEEIAYGGREARPEDAAEARERWGRVLAETRR